ncbi:MAG: hypothetical protein WBI20_11115 [Burkholderiaceae bacterium]
MKTPENPACKVSQSELDALGAPLNPLLYGGVDRFFKWRNLFLILAATLMLIRLLFYSYDLLPVVHALQNTNIDAKEYLKLRALYLSVVMVIYLTSYLRDWYFAQVALIVFALALSGLAMDFFNFFLYYDNWPKSVIVTFVLRLLAIGSLFLNALLVHRAPPMPRTLWS